MNKLSKEKKIQLVWAVVCTLGIVAMLYFAVIRHQLAGLKVLNNNNAEKKASVEKILDTIKNSKQIEAELGVVNNKLQLKEEEMASGDLYSFMITFITKFKQPYNVDIPQFINSGGAATDVSLLPKFPYKQFTVVIGGTAYYHDLGQFVAAFENRFPSSRVLNLELLPASTQNPDEREKLTFRMDVVSLVKPGGARPAGTP